MCIVDMDVILWVWKHVSAGADHVRAVFNGTGMNEAV